MGARALRHPAPAGVHHLTPGEPPGQPPQQHHGQEVRDPGEGMLGSKPSPETPTALTTACVVVMVRAQVANIGSWVLDLCLMQ